MHFDLRQSWIQRVKAETSLWDVARRFVSVDTDARTISRCPACEATMRGSSDSRAPVGVRDDDKGWHCHRCGVGGDVIDLVAHSLGCRRFRDADRDERKSVTGWFDTHARMLARVGPIVPIAVPQGALGRPTATAAVPALASAPTPPKTLPPQHEVENLWAACDRLSDGHQIDLQTWQFLKARNLSADELGRLDAARLLPVPPYVYPKWWPYEGYRWRLVVAAYTVDGTLASIQGRTTMGDERKTNWPRGHKARELLMADVAGVMFLRGQATQVQAVLVVEGLTDLLAAACWVACTGRQMPVLSVTSGSASAFARFTNWLPSLPCIIATDPDDKGDYAAKIRRALPAHVPVLRALLVPDGRPVGKLDFCSATDAQREFALARATPMVAQG